MTQSWIDYLIIVAYFVAVLGIGFYCSRGEKSSVNYLLGGRKMPAVAVGLACMMALLSSISLVQVPGEIYNYGLTLFIISGTLGMLLNIPAYLLFVRFYFRLGSFTPYEYLEYRYDSSVRAIVAISAFYARTMYLAMVLYTTAKIFEASYHWAPWFSILLVGVVGMIYTVKGGAKAVVWTDVLQFFVLFGSFVLLIILVCTKIDGGAVEAVRCAFADGHGVPQFSDPDFYSLSPYVRLLFFLMIWNAFIAPLTSACSDQITIQRYLSTKNWKEGFKAKLVATGSALIFTLMLWFTGLAIYTYYVQNPAGAPGAGEGDKAFFVFMANHLPTPMPGLFMAGMLAAIMSTLSAGMNSMATIWLKEFHVKFINKKLDDAGEVRISKLATLWIGVFSILLALALEVSGKWLSQSVSEVGTLFGLLGAAILPAFLFAVLSSRANSKLIWAYTAFAFGEGWGWNAWYALSRSDWQAWVRDNSLPWGYAGKIGFTMVLWPLIIGLVILIPYAFKKLRRMWIGKVSALGGMAVLGYAEAILIWYIYSNALITDVPQARSFYFFLPISLIGAFVVLLFCPKQPKEKYQGLTVWTLDEPILNQNSAESDEK